MLGKSESDLLASLVHVLAYTSVCYSVLEKTNVDQYEQSKGKSSGTTTNGYAAPTADEESQQSSVLKLLKDAKDVVCVSYHHVDKKRGSH